MKVSVNLQDLSDVHLHKLYNALFLKLVHEDVHMTSKQRAKVALLLQNIKAHLIRRGLTPPSRNVRNLPTLENRVV